MRYMKQREAVMRNTNGNFFSFVKNAQYSIDFNRINKRQSFLAQFIHNERSGGSRNRGNLLPQIVLPKKEALSPVPNFALE